MPPAGSAPSSAYAAPDIADPFYLPGVVANLEDGIYRELIDTARAAGSEYSRIWDLFAFRESFTVHLARFTEGVLRTPSVLSRAMRELIAAATSAQNECRFCTEAHAAAAAELFGSEALVRGAIADVETCGLPPAEKALLRFTNKVTRSLPAIGKPDIEQVRAAGWDDEAIYYAITTCALFNFYNRWITPSGVPEMSREAHRQQGRNIARGGYIREEKIEAKKEKEEKK